MMAKVLQVFIVACMTMLTLRASHAGDRRFDDLLAQAQAQAAAGHNIVPAGDNVAETILALYRLVSVATPEQLDALSALLERESRAEHKALNDTGAVRTPPAATAPEASPPLASIRPMNPGPALQGFDPRTVDLLAKGRAAEGRGDISAARRFYAGAAQRGEATAARLLGRLYDPAYVGQVLVGGVEADIGLASHWYKIAVTLGDTQAPALLNTLTAR